MNVLLFTKEDGMYFYW